MGSTYSTASALIVQLPSTTASHAHTAAPPPRVNPIAPYANPLITVSCHRDSTSVVNAPLMDAKSVKLTKIKPLSALSVNEAKHYSTAHATPVPRAFS